MSAPWLPPDAARALAWWDDESLRRIGTAVEAALAQWQAAWGLQAQGPQCQCRAITSASVFDEGWQALAGADAEAQAWLQVEQAANQRLAAELFGTEVAGPMALAVATACHDDALERLARSLSLEPSSGARSSIPAAAVRPWSGAMVAELAGGFAARLVISGEAARRWQRRPLPASNDPAQAAAVPLTPTADALSRQPLTLGVHLEGCELTLGAVQDLQVGDVVRIGHSLEAPARITDATGARTFSGYLGRQGAHKAVELVRPVQHKVPS